MKCEGINDVPYTSMRRGAPTTWVQEPCQEEVVEGKKYCAVHQLKDDNQKEYWKNIQMKPSMKEFLEKCKVKKET